MGVNKVFPIVKCKRCKFYNFARTIMLLQPNLTCKDHLFFSERGLLKCFAPIVFNLPKSFKVQLYAFGL